MSTPVLARCAQQLKIRPPETPLLEMLPKETFTGEMPFLSRKKPVFRSITAFLC